MAEGDAKAEALGLIERLGALAATLPDAERREVAARLGGISASVCGAEPSRALSAALQHGEGDAVDGGRMLELSTMLVEFVTSVDQVVWSTWRAVAPNSNLKRTNPARQTMGRYAAGDAAVTRGLVKQDLERLRQLTAALIAGVNQAGRQFAQRHVERFAPTEIESLAKMGTGRGLSEMLVGHEVKCWRKYVELAGPMDTASVERELMNAVAAYAESLMRGVGGVVGGGGSAGASGGSR